MKKILSILLSVAILITMASVIAVTADTGWHVLYDWENEEGTDGSYISTVNTDKGALKSVIVKERTKYDTKSEYQLLENSEKMAMFYNDKTFDPELTMRPENGSTPGTIELPKLTGATGLKANLHIKKIAATYTTGFYIGFVLNDEAYYYQLKPADYATSSQWFEFVGKTYNKLNSEETYELKAEDVEDLTAIAGWVYTSGWHGILIDNIEYYGEEIKFQNEENDETLYQVTPGGSWSTVFDWENEGEDKSEITSATTDKGDNMSICVKDVAAYQGSAEYGLLEGSTKAIWVYNAIGNEEHSAGTNNPQNANNPASITLPDVSNAEDIRMFLHIKQKDYSLENFYTGLVINNQPYFTAITKTDFYQGSYYSFVGKTLSKLGGGKGIKVKTSDIPNIQAILFWIQTSGYSAILIDNIDIYNPDAEGSTTEPTSPSTEPTDPSTEPTTAEPAPVEGWNVMFDWENEADEDLAEITSTTVNLGDIKRVALKLISVYDSAGAYAGRLLENSTKAVMFYNDYNYTNGTTCSPLNNNVPGTIDLKSLAGATDLRVNLHIKQTAKNDNFFIGVIMNGETYYTPIAKADYGTATYYSFVGKTLTKMGTEDTVTLTSSDIPNITALAGWVNTTDGWPAILVDNIEYYYGELPTEPTNPSTEPTDPSTEPTNPSTEPTEVSTTATTAITPTQKTTQPPKPVTPVKITLKKPSIKVTAGKKKLTVTITKVKYAKKYVIYYKLAKAKKWKKITVKANSKKSITKVIKKLSKGKQYKVKVIAYRGSIKSKASKTYTKKVK